MTSKTFSHTDTSPASSGTVASTTAIFRGLARFDAFTIDAALQGATGDTLDVYLQREIDSTWVDWMHFAQLADAASAIRYTVDSASVADGAIVVGSGTSPVLTAGKLSCAHPGDAVRVVFVAGASTSAGAAQTIKITGRRANG